MKKEIEIINGKINSKNFSCSLDKDLATSLIFALGGGTQILRKFFCIRFNLKDEWELENLIQELILEKVGIDKRKKLSQELTKTMCDFCIDYFDKEILKKDEYDLNAKNEFKGWIEKAKKIKEDLNKGEN
jgi:hypothetical protein